MAVHAREHAAVDGIFEPLGIDMQADSLAIYLVAQGGVAVARQALLSRGFRRLLAGGWFACCEDVSGGD
jgi:hypothetical protein